MKTIAIYHKDCNDGTTAAAVVLRKYPDALTFPFSHGYFPEEIEEIVQKAEPGDRIFTVDCVMGVKEFLAKGFKVISIDHHAGVQDYMSELDKENENFTYVFDNGKSGASLSWAYFFPQEPVPELIKLIEDVDLWKWQYGENSKALNNYVFMLANKPEEVLKLLDSPLDTAMSEGRAISRYADFMIDLAVKTIDPVTMRIGGRDVPLYNMGSYKSEIGNVLAKAKDCAVGIFNIDGGTVKISFRSLDSHSPSALDLAKALGGGGHKNSSGAGIPLDDFWKALKK